MKQTSVEWLAKELESYGDPQKCVITWEDFDFLVNQAKEMEKQEIINAYKQGQHDSEPIRPTDAEQYYNQTFKSE